MPSVKVERGLVDASVPATGRIGVYACDDGTVEVMVEQDGVKMTVTMHADESDSLGVLAIRMGVIARGVAAQRAAAAAAPKVLVPSFSVPPDVAKNLAAARKNGHGG